MSSTGRTIAAVVFSLIVSPFLMVASSVAANVAGPGAQPKGAKAQDAKASAAKAPQVAKLTAEQIVEKHVAARGGAQAWKSVQTIQLSGMLDAGRGDLDARAAKMVRSGKKYVKEGPLDTTAPSDQAKDADKQVQLPFTLDVSRPNKSRMEVVFDGKTAVQVYDGAHGWKVRPFLNRNDVEPFTPAEAKSQASANGIDGPLIDYAAKGTKISLEGVEQVSGQPAYKLKVTPKNGSAQHVWIDASSFLDVKMDGAARRMDGKMHDVFVYQRDFRSVQGVKIPFLVETTVAGYSDTHKMVVEKASINPKLDDAVFAKPHA
jgi:hypothetical protein